MSLSSATTGTANTSAVDKQERVAVDRNLLIHPQHHPDEHRTPFVWVSGKGSWLTNLECERYIDGLSGMWNVHLGQGR